MLSSRREIRESIRAIRYMFPPSARATFRRLHRRYVFRRALQDVDRTAGLGASPAAALLEALVYGWGNHTFSARHEFLAALLEYGRVANGPILECGSGLSTIVLATVSRQQVWSLEHDPTWGKHTQVALDRNGCTHAHVLSAPLRNYGQFTWYDPPLDVMPCDFALVVCDGPPAGTPGGRFGLMPLMRPRVRSGCVVLLDDASRAGERHVAEEWARKFDMTCSMVGERQRYAVLTVPG